MALPLPTGTEFVFKLLPVLYSSTSLSLNIIRFLDYHAAVRCVLHISAPIFDLLMIFTVYYRLYDPSGTRPKTVLKKNTFVSAQDTAVGRIDISGRIGVNIVKGITKAIANCENCGETYESSDVWVYADFGWTKFLPGSSIRPQGVGTAGSSQNKPLLIKFSVSIDPERQSKGSGAVFLVYDTADTDSRSTVLADGTTMSPDGSGSQDGPPPAYEPPVDSRLSLHTIVLG